MVNNLPVQQQSVVNFLRLPPPVVENELQTPPTSVSEDVLQGSQSLPLSIRKNQPKAISSKSLNKPATATMSEANTVTYMCRLCERMFHELDEMIGIYSDQGRQLQIVMKMFYALSIMTTEEDPTSNYICKVCSGHLECNFQFAWSCRSKNYERVINILKLSQKNTFYEELKKILRVPSQSLYFKSSTSSTLNEVYETLTTYMKNPESNLKTFNRYLEQKILNALETKILESKELVQTPTVQLNQFNMDFTNRLNINNNNTNLIPRITIRNRNQIITNGFTISNNSNSDQNHDDAQSSGNETNDTLNDEVICLDDDDDDDNIDEINNGDITDPQVETNVNPLSKLVLNNNYRIEKSKVPENQSNGLLRNALEIDGKLKSINQRPTNQNGSKKKTNRHSSFSNVPSEDVTITPDMPLLNFGADSPLNQAEDNYFEEPLHMISEPPLVTPETGIHFLFEPRETVDLTAEIPQRKQGQKRKNKSEIKKPLPAKKIRPKTTIASKNEEKNNQLPLEVSPKADVEPSITIEKRKICLKTISPKNDEKEIQSPPKSSCTADAKSKAVAKTKTRAVKKINTPIRFSTRLCFKPITKPIPKRVTSVSTSSSPSIFNENELTNDSDDYSHILGKYTEIVWQVKLTRIELSKYKCPICEVYFYSIKSRQTHETLTHFLSVELSTSSVESIQESENTSNTEQQEFLLYLNLVKKRPLKQRTMDILASRPNLLKSLKNFGNTTGSFKCRHCGYKTTRLFILWAHTTYHHNEPVVEKKSNPFCFLCNRTLTKRITLLKHVDQCIKNRLKKEATVVSTPVKHFTCDICNENLNSVSDLEKHFYNHVAIARRNKTIN